MVDSVQARGAKTNSARAETSDRAAPPYFRKIDRFATNGRKPAGQEGFRLMRPSRTAFAHRLFRLGDPTTHKIPVQPRTIREANGLPGRTGHSSLIRSVTEVSGEVECPHILPRITHDDDYPGWIWLGLVNRRKVPRMGWTDVMATEQGPPGHRSTAANRFEPRSHHARESDCCGGPCRVPISFDRVTGHR